MKVVYLQFEKKTLIGKILIKNMISNILNVNNDVL